MKTKKRYLFVISIFTSVFMLAGCYPSGNWVGKAEFSTLDSSFAAADWIGKLDINANAVTTPNGTRYRITKMALTFPGHEISFKSSKTMNVIPGPIPKDLILASQVKGRNSCGYLVGNLDNGSEFFAYLLVNPTTGAQEFSFYNNEYGNFFIGSPITGKIQLGGRNLCDNLF